MKAIRSVWDNLKSKIPRETWLRCQSVTIIQLETNQDWVTCQHMETYKIKVMDPTEEEPSIIIQIHQLPPPTTGKAPPSNWWYPTSTVLFQSQENKISSGTLRTCNIKATINVNTRVMFLALSMWWIWRRVWRTIWIRMWLITYIMHHYKLTNRYLSLRMIMCLGDNNYWIYMKLNNNHY